MNADVESEGTVTHGALTPQLFAAAWMAVVLAFTLEALTALGAFTLGRGTTTQVFLANVGQKVSWGTFVCVALAFAKAFKPRDPGVVAWAGILGAPAAFTVARSIHKGLSQAMGLSVASAAPALLVLLTTLKSLEYGILGAALARHDERENATLRQYVGTGLWVGVLFGGLTLAASGFLAPAKPTAAEWLARAVNEVLFPVGCSLILYAATVAGRRLN
jgi:hypothetical protein